MLVKASFGFWLRIGMVILVLMAAGALFWPDAASAAPVHDEAVTYVVKSGDTLRSIAARYGTTIGAIVRANGLKNPDVIYPGQRLVIPVRSSSTPSSGEPEAAQPLRAAARRLALPHRPAAAAFTTSFDLAIPWIRSPEPMASAPQSIVRANGHQQSRFDLGGAEADRFPARRGLRHRAQRPRFNPSLNHLRRPARPSTWYRRATLWARSPSATASPYQLSWP